MKMMTTQTKIALIREEGYPVGVTAPLNAKCICGATITHLNFRDDKDG